MNDTDIYLYKNENLKKWLKKLREFYEDSWYAYLAGTEYAT